MENIIIAIDFDGTLCSNAYPLIGEANEEMIRHIKHQKAIGAKIILWTCRFGEKLEEAIDWCKDHGIEFDAVNENVPESIELFGSDTRKVFANEYIDDRANIACYDLPYHPKPMQSEEK